MDPWEKLLEIKRKAIPRKPVAISYNLLCALLRDNERNISQSRREIVTPADYYGKGDW